MDPIWWTKILISLKFELKTWIFGVADLESDFRSTPNLSSKFTGLMLMKLLGYNGAEFGIHLKMAITLQGKIVDDHATAHFEGKE
ncbi:hypothetical protein EAG_11069 [Camponotus floridanus]|uniref:Uncharacterized protein n=1 Tax=Camponotus floridanus TaxID=104421 RepID=E2A5F6_CAMFO|nr:hypothetical protein EAG_11069 [Camponotus floridanus]